MRRPAIIGGLVLAVVAGSVLPVQAEALWSAPVPSKGRFTHLDLHSMGKIRNLPSSLRTDETVTALVQLAGDPVSVQRRRSTAARTRFDTTTARRRLEASHTGARSKLRTAGARVEGDLSTVLNAVQVRVKVRDLPKVAAVPGVEQVQVSRAITRDNGAADAYTGTVQYTFAEGAMTVAMSGKKVGECNNPQ
jgi:hypothetical protein